jgi:transcriptional regulator with XRE-family HTH domain
MGFGSVSLTGGLYSEFAGASAFDGHVVRLLIHMLMLDVWKELAAKAKCAVTAYRLTLNAVSAHRRIVGDTLCESGRRPNPAPAFHLQFSDEALSMTDEAFLNDDLVALRKELGLTQQGMADKFDMAIRSYQSIEAGESEYRYIHRLAAERVALSVAVDKKDPSLVPAPVRQDALELVRLGQLLQNPAYRWNAGYDAQPQAAPDQKQSDFRAAYAVVGEIVLLATALDHQLNHVVMQVLALTDSPMLEAVVATLDTIRKIEMVKARSKHIAQPTWRKPVVSYLDKLERISKWRNIACHTPLIPDSKHGAVFAPTAAAKLLKNLDLQEPTSRRIPVAELESAIKLGSSALGDGENLIENFKKMNDARAIRLGK